MTVAAVRSHGIERARALLDRLGNPQDEARTVHVAGTAGKGSVCAFVASVLTAHGFRLGAHLSPHAYSVLERFRLGGSPVSAETLAATLDVVRPAADAVGATFFEVTNAVAFSLFAGRVDYSVIETGLGGLLDSTNTITRPDKLAVITRIGLDHTEVLGSTLPEIAAQKAGILTPNGRALSLRTSPEVDAVLAREAAARDCALEFVDGPLVPAVPLGLPGRHQAVNAHVAVRAVETLAERDGWAVDPDAVRAGLASTVLPGRFERRTIDGRPVILDGAHNPLKLGSVVAALREVHGPRPVPWVLALKPDKDLDAVARTIAPAAEMVVATEFHAPAGDHPATTSRPAAEVAEAARAAGIPAITEPDPVAALRKAGPGEPVVVAGSFHLLAAFGRP